MRNIGFSIANICTEQFATIDSKFNSTLEKELKVDFSINFGIKPADKLLACFINIEYYTENHTYIVLKLRVEFSISPKSWVKLKQPKTNRIKFSKEFLRHLGVISVGTARGVLHSKTENTAFNKFVLPTINLIEVIQKDFSPKID